MAVDDGRAKDTAGFIIKKKVESQMQKSVAKIFNALVYSGNQF